MWNNSDFDVIKFTSAHFPFPKDFLADYKSISGWVSLKLSNLKENHLLKIPLMEHASKYMNTQIENELKSKLTGY